METLDYDHRLFENRFAGDGALMVRFFESVMPDLEKSKAGKPVHRDVIMIQIMVPGDKTNIICREIEERDKERFAKQWAHWEKTRSEVPEGYRISEWAGVTRALAEDLRYQGFFTVEQLAAASDSVLSKMPGLRELSRRANIFVEQMEGMAPANKLQAELEARDNEIAAMKEQLAALQALVAANKPFQPGA